MKTAPKKAEQLHPQPHAFTLVELLVVLAIVAILMLLLLPALSNTIDKHRSAACASNLRQAGIAFNLYAQDNDGKFPQSWNRETGNYWYNELTNNSVNTSSYTGAAAIPDCLAIDKPTNAHAAAGGYGMAALILWSPSLKRTDTDQHFYTTRLRTPDKWPLLMDADTPQILSLDNPQADNDRAQRFSARHNGLANILMADLHIEQAAYGDKRFSQSTLNSNHYYD